MAGILNIASSSLTAFKYALSVTANNIDNAETRGYTRQTVQFSPVNSQLYGNTYIGGGVNLSMVRRDSDRFANQQVRETLTIMSHYEAFYQQAIQVDKLISEKGTSLSTGVQTFLIL